MWVCIYWGEPGAFSSFFLRVAMKTRREAMSFSQLLLRRSTTWLFGFWFCLYYELVLLWQMPIAWFTFWKSTWGTRMTMRDVEAQEKKNNRLSGKNKNGSREGKEEKKDP